MAGLHIWQVYLLDNGHTNKQDEETGNPLWMGKEKNNLIFNIGIDPRFDFIGIVFIINGDGYRTLRTVCLTPSAPPATISMYSLAFYKTYGIERTGCDTGAASGALIIHLDDQTLYGFNYAVKVFSRYMLI